MPAVKAVSLISPVFEDGFIAHLMSISVSIMLTENMLVKHQREAVYYLSSGRVADCSAHHSLAG